jgi:tRNA nucleotidyltransferase (CCA-adding enzyme)
MSLEAEVLKRVVPSAEEERRIRATVEDVCSRVALAVKAHNIAAEPLLVGSVAKGTHLSQAEIDVFVLFPRETTRETLEKVGLALGEFLEDKKRMYAEHPYTRGRWNGFEVEVVPCYRIRDASEKMSAVDRTPLHARYVIERIGRDQRDQVRLLKAFCEGVGVYGAEARVQGFSGYLCELLGLKSGTFAGVLEAAMRWRAHETVIALEGPPAKPFPEPLVVVDPIDAGRNVASAVSEETLATFVHAAKTFLAKPKLEFFFPKPRKPLTGPQAKRMLAARGTTLLGITIPAPNLTEDVLYPQIRKAHRAVEDACRRADFRIARSRFGVVGATILLLFEFEVFALPVAQKHRGPPVWVKNADDFLAKWRGAKGALGAPRIEGDHWVVDIRRVSKDAAQLVRSHLPSWSLGSNLDKAAKKGRILRDAQLFTKPLLPEVTQLLDPRFPWE